MITSLTDSETMDMDGSSLDKNGETMDRDGETIDRVCASMDMDGTLELTDETMIGTKTV
jgi:hypothetical protein